MIINTSMLQGAYEELESHSILNRFLAVEGTSVQVLAEKVQQFINSNPHLKRTFSLEMDQLAEELAHKKWLVVRSGFVSLTDRIKMPFWAPRQLRDYIDYFTECIAENPVQCFSEKHTMEASILQSRLDISGEEDCPICGERLYRTESGELEVSEYLQGDVTDYLEEVAKEGRRREERERALEKNVTDDSMGNISEEEWLPLKYRLKLQKILNHRNSVVWMTASVISTIAMEILKSSMLLTQIINFPIRILEMGYLTINKDVRLFDAKLFWNLLGYFSLLFPYGRIASVIIDVMNIGWKFFGEKKLLQKERA